MIRAQSVVVNVLRQSSIKAQLVEVDVLRQSSIKAQFVEDDVPRRSSIKAHFVGVDAHIDPRAERKFHDSIIKSAEINPASPCCKGRCLKETVGIKKAD